MKPSPHIPRVEPSQHFLILPVYASHCEHLPRMATTTQLTPTPCNLSTQTPKLRPRKNRCICVKNITESKSQKHPACTGGRSLPSATLGLKRPVEMGKWGGEGMTLLSSWEKIATNTPPSNKTLLFPSTRELFLSQKRPQHFKDRPNK